MMSHERGRGDGAGGGLCYGFDGRRFTLQADADGDLWLPDWPVTQVSWDAARACMRWRGGQLGLPLRLPAELEWEKAARGVDGRLYPWGDHFDPSWCSMTESVEGRNKVTPVTWFPTDESVYGVRGMAGGQHDWCLGRFDVAPPAGGARVPLPVDDDPGDPQILRVLRGGSWVSDRRYCRLYARVRTAQSIPFALVGVRGAALAPVDWWATLHRAAGR